MLFFDMQVNTSGIPSAAHFEIKNRKVVGKDLPTFTYYEY